MAVKPKYPGVTPIDGGWQYRLKVKLNDGTVFDTKIKKDLNGNPFLTARAAYEAKEAHKARLLTPLLNPSSEPLSASLSYVYNKYINTEGKDKAPATLRKQDSMWRNHIKPQFGDRDINSFNVVEINSFLSDLYKKHAYKYVESFLRFFYLLFGFADRLGVIDSEVYNKLIVNENTRISMPKMNQIDYEDELSGATVYEDLELYRLEKIFKSEDGNLLLAFYLGLYCGLRISEVFGLRWSCVDWTDRTIKVDRQMSYQDGEIRLTEVKTLKAVRNVLIPDFLYEELEFAYSQQEHQKEQLGYAYKNTERVYDEVTKQIITGGDFINRKKNGEILTVNSLKYWSKKIKKESKIDFKFHNLRHTYATRAAALIPVSALMNLLGHKKLDTTMKYYYNADSDFVRERTRRLINDLYDYQNVLGITAKEIKKDD